MKLPGSVYSNKDITMALYRMDRRPLGRCLQDVISVGFIDTASIGCVASKVVLYASLITIIGVVALRFALAVFYQWFFAWKVGNFPAETAEERKTRAAEIEAWSDGIYLPAPNRYRPDVGKNGVLKKPWKSFLPAQSRFSMAVPQRYSTAPVDGRPRALSLNFPSTPTLSSPLPFQSHRVVPQPPPDYEPFNFALAHTICLVTAYSESEEGMRTTLDSLATTDYPNSHKVILIIADGMVKGAGNELTTPEICLSMMKETQTWSEVPAHSYVAIADGHKRHNMAKVFSGFYKYDDVTCERSKQQRVPIVLIAKCGNPLEAGDSKPGNRGKRDSQMVLMSFLEKVMFDERMTTLEYEFFNALWGVTGVSPDKYELVLCVDADTKAFPDSLSRMVACMVHDVSIMGLCGETKIANKADSWVAMIQGEVPEHVVLHSADIDNTAVFEYYISHHLTKAFESLFGIVSCLPGCFSMYRIKAPKNDQSGYWIPILANPDIIEHYSENVVDTLHKKNLLLLGEDRYLTTLLLKTFPKRKNIFCQQAICKTIVPDTFSVLLSQRRRWINSTVHNLFELVLVRESCGTFCFSMQFMVAVELLGTLVLPAAISFTLYLIISSIVPGGSNNTVSLVLLALVLGLPGLLIVITSTKVAYVGWMLIYLLSLPIWNGILPAYAYWHFDDFSWGQTRKIEGDATHTGDKEGEFDSSHIVMKRWSEFERDKAVREGRVQANRRSFASHTSRSSAGFDGGFREGFNTANLYRDNIGLIRVPAPLSVPVTPLSSSRQLTPRSSSLGSDDRYDSPPPSSLLPLSATSSVSSRLPSRSRLLDSPVPKSSFDLNPFRDSSPDTEAVDMYLNDAVPPRRSRFQPVQLVDHGPVPINQ
ncbi:unnamed protein product [Mycena citricolor]|uniref:chitin synthase n=1 Tax=Mycena citricolor TaxID=2018698 RepID=A0AAD2JYT5_9AGAR|nr:unnamed protein product [Mycena citricolor]